jgi:hypothetical protein
LVFLYSSFDSGVDSIISIYEAADGLIYKYASHRSKQHCSCGGGLSFLCPRRLLKVILAPLTASYALLLTYLSTNHRSTSHS